MAYSDKVLEHYENPRNVGRMDEKDPNVGTGLVGAPSCGDLVRLQIRVDDDGVIGKETISLLCIFSTFFINTIHYITS